MINYCGHFFNGSFIPLTGWGGIGMIIFTALVILAIFFIVRASNKQNNEESDKSILDILKKRYANGEITKEEFDAKKMELL